MKAITIKLATLTLALASAVIALPSVAAIQPNQATTAQQACRCFEAQVTGQGPALILIPGVASSADVWQATVNALKDRYQLHVLTLAGFAGVAPIPMQSWGEGYLQLQQQAILRYIREQKLDKPVIIGHSLGGYLALALAATAPEQIGAAINVDGLPALGALMAQNSAVADGNARPQASFDPMAMAQQMASNKEWQQQIVKDMYRSDGQTSGRVMGELMRADLRDQLQHIAVPVLTIGALQHGAPYSTPEQVQENYQAQLANAPTQYHRFAFARDSKHFIMADAPDWLQQQIEQFLTELK